MTLLWSREPERAMHTSVGDLRCRLLLQGRTLHHNRNSCQHQWSIYSVLSPLPMLTLCWDSTATLPCKCRTDGLLVAQPQLSVAFKGTALGRKKLNWRQSKPPLQSLEKTSKGKCILSTKQKFNFFLSYLCYSQYLFPATQLLQEQSTLFLNIPSTQLFSSSPSSSPASTHPSSPCHQGSQYWLHVP